MSNSVDKPEKKPAPKSVMLVDRKAFLSAIVISTQILDAMTDELQASKESKDMTPATKRALQQLLRAHIQNAALLGDTLSHCLVDPADIEGVKPPDLH